MSILVKRGNVNIQNYVEAGASVSNTYNGPVNFGGNEVTKSDDDHVPTDEEVKTALNKVKDRITTNRLWFAIYRPLVMKKKVKDGLFDQFKQYIESLLDELPKPIDARDLQSKMDVQSFQKDVKDWDPENAPVTGKIFLAYYNLANDFLQLLNESDIDADEFDDEDKKELKSLK